MATNLAPIPANVEVLESERAALAETCKYTRKGAIPETTVTRQQLIEDVLARGYTKRDFTERSGRMVSLKLENPETGQYYRFNKTAEMTYANRRWEQTMTVQQGVEPSAPAQGPAPAQIPTAIDEGWRIGEKVTQELHWGGKAHLVRGEVYVNSSQRWRIRVVDAAGAPGLRPGNSFPATAAWSRVVPVAGMAIPPAQASAQRAAQPVVPQAPESVVVSGSGAPDVGSVVELLPEVGGRVRGIVIKTNRPGQEEYRVRIVRVEGMAGRTFARGASLAWSPEWQIVPQVPALVAQESEAAVDQVAGRDGRWWSGPEPMATIPGEPIDYMDVPRNGDLGAASAVVVQVETPKGVRFEGRLPDGYNVPNPANKGSLAEASYFESVDDAKAATQAWVTRSAHERVRGELRDGILARMQDVIAQHAGKPISIGAVRRNAAMIADLNVNASHVFGEYLHKHAGTLTPDEVAFFNANTSKSFQEDMHAALMAELMRAGLRRNGVAYTEHATVRVVPMDSAPVPADPDSPHFMVEEVRDGQRRNIVGPLTLAGAIEETVALQFPFDIVRAPGDQGASVVQTSEAPAASPEAEEAEDSESEESEDAQSAAEEEVVVHAPELSPRQQFMDECRAEQQFALDVLGAKGASVREAVENRVVTPERAREIVASGVSKELFSEAWGGYVNRQIEYGAAMIADVEPLREWRLSGMTIVPAKPGKKFSEEERFRVLSTVLKAGGSVLITKRGDLRFDSSMDDAKAIYESHGMGSVHVDRAVAREADRAAAEKARHDAQAAVLAKHPEAVKWLDELFGADVLNPFNKAAMVRYVVGEAETYDGISNHRWLPALRKVGVEDAKSLSDEVLAVRHAYEAHLEDEKTKCPANKSLFAFLPKGETYQNGVKPGAKKLAQFKEALHARRVPPIYTQSSMGDDAIAHLKLFDPTGSYTRYITEWDGKDEVFGYVDGDFGELGGMSLKELSELRGRMGIGVEIDMHFLPTPLREIRAERAERVSPPQPRPEAEDLDRAADAIVASVRENLQQEAQIAAEGDAALDQQEAAKAQQPEVRRGFSVFMSDTGVGGPAVTNYEGDGSIPAIYATEAEAQAQASSEDEYVLPVEYHTGDRTLIVSPGTPEEERYISVNGQYRLETAWKQPAAAESYRIEMVKGDDAARQALESLEKTVAGRSSTQREMQAWKDAFLAKHERNGAEFRIVPGMVPAVDLSSADQAEAFRKRIEAGAIRTDGRLDPVEGDRVYCMDEGRRVEGQVEGRVVSEGGRRLVVAVEDAAFAREMPLGSRWTVVGDPEAEGYDQEQLAKTLWKGVPRGKPVRELTDLEAALVLAPAAESMTVRNREMAQLATDPRLRCSVPTHPGAFQFDGWAAVEYVRNGKLSKYGQSIESVAQVVRDAFTAKGMALPTPEAQLKVAAHLRNAVVNRTYNDILHPDNQASRMAFEKLTGMRLPKGVAVSKEAVAQLKPEQVTMDLPAYPEPAPSPVDAGVLAQAEKDARARMQAMENASSRLRTERALAGGHQKVSHETLFVGAQLAYHGGGATQKGVVHSIESDGSFYWTPEGEAGAVYSGNPEYAGLFFTLPAQERKEVQPNTVFETLKFTSQSEAETWMRSNGIERGKFSKEATELFALTYERPKDRQITLPAAWYIGPDDKPRFTTPADKDYGFGLHGPYTADYVMEAHGLDRTEVHAQERRHDPALMLGHYLSTLPALQKPRAEAALERQVRVFSFKSSGEVMTIAQLVQREAAFGARLEVARVDDMSVERKYRNEWERLRRTAPTGNPNHPQTIRYMELRKIFQDGERPKKDERRLFSSDGHTFRDEESLGVTGMNFAAYVLRVMAEDKARAQASAPVVAEAPVEPAPAAGVAIPPAESVSPAQVAVAFTGELAREQGEAVGTVVPRTDEEVFDLAAQYGREAFAAGTMAVPAADARYMQLLKDYGQSKHVGWSIAVSEAWSSAWHKANAAAPVPELEEVKPVALAPAVEASAPRSFKVEVTDGSGFASNGLRFYTESQAKEYGVDLLSRWTAAREFRVVPSMDAPNHGVPPAEETVQAQQQAAVEEVAQVNKEASAAQSIAGGSVPVVPQDLPAPLSIVERHTEAGPVRMVVVAASESGVQALPVDAYLRGEEIAMESVPVSEVTVPSGKLILSRQDGECMNAIAAAALKAKAAGGAEDAEAEALDALANAAGAGRIADVQRLISDPGVAIMLGAPVEGFRLEVGRIQEKRARERAPEEKNWYFGRGDRIAPRSVETRTRANLAAVKLLKKLEADGRLASPEEKEVLAKFSGWGSMKGIFDDDQARNYAELEQDYKRNPQRYVYDASVGRGDYKKVSFAEFVEDSPFNKGLHAWHERWGKAREDLKSLLTEEEFLRAGLSAINAHYTEESVCHRLWDIAKQLGFQGGTVVEPAVGSGRVISAMPPELRDKCRVVAVEKDVFSAQLARHLIPEAKVHVDGFESAPVKTASADLIITNVPFSDTQIGDSGLNLHNFFIQQSMAKLKPGGLAVLITTAHTLDSSAEQRAKLVGQMEMVGAFRLPNDAFKGSSGTDVVTDILMLRKPAQHLTPIGETFTSVLPVTVPEDQRPEPKKDPYAVILDKDEAPSLALVNEYFVRNPEHVLGVHSLKGKMYGKGSEPQYTVATPSKETRELDERLDAAIATLSPVPNSSQTRQAALTEEELESVRIAALKEEKVGSVVARNGRLYRVNDSRELVDWSAPDEVARDAKASARAQSMVASYVKIRTAFVSLIVADLSKVTTDEESASMRKALRKEYQSFVKEFGSLNEPRTRKALKELVGSDPDFFTVMAIEDVKIERKDRRRTVVCSPARMLTERTLFPSQAPQNAANIDEAALISLAERGRLDPAYMATLLGRAGEAGAEETRKEALREGIAFVNPVTGALDHRELYLSGDVLTKLDEARKAALDDPDFAPNVTALERAQPPVIPYEEARPTIASAWLPHETLTQFVKAEFGLSYNRRMVYDPESGWKPSGVDTNWRGAFGWDSEVQNKYGSDSMNYLDVLANALKGKTPPIYKEVETAEGKKRVFDEVATREIEQRVDAVRSRFLEWLAAPAQVTERERVQEKYNKSFNRVVLTKWDGSRLRFPGLAKGSFEPMTHQRDAVMRILLMQRGVIAHGVGFGKTLEIILAAMESKRLGMANKPMVVCDNANYEQIVATVRQCYPQARILHAEEGDMSPAKREEFKGRITSGDYDLVLMSRSQFGRVRVSPEREVAHLVSDLNSLSSISGDGESRAARQQLKAKEKVLAKAEERLRKLREKGGVGLTWEQLGVDMLFVDESHRHKKIGINTRFDGIKGIDTAISQRGLDLLLKAQHIQEKRGGGRGAIGFTGTPCSNTMAEYWTGVKIFDPENLKSFSIETFDQFATAFAQTENSLEMNEANGRWRVVERLKKFINGREFIRFISASYDVRMDASELGLERPSHEKGDIELGSCPLTRLVHQGKQEIADIYREWEAMEKEEKAELGWIPLVLMQLNIALSIDPRLVDPKAPVGKDALISGVADEIARIHHENNKPGKDCTHTQVVFCDRRNTINGQVSLTLGNRADGESLGLSAIKSKGLEVDTSKVLVTEDDDEEESEAKPEKSEKSEGLEKAMKAIGSFNLWEELRSQLVARGIPRDKIALITDARSKADKLEIFERMNTGELAVLVGSSDTLGIGSNFQKRLYAAHNIDPARTMTPDAMEQRHGRTLRQGNSHKQVRIICYGMENTVIPAIYGRIQTKGAFAKQAFTKGVGVEFEETSDLRTEEMRAMLLTDKRAMDRQMLNEQIRNLKLDEQAAGRRAGALRQKQDSCRWNIDYIRKNSLPENQRVRAWFRDSVVPPSRTDTWKAKLCLHNVPPSHAEEAVLKKLSLKADANGVVHIEGSQEKVHAALDKIFEVWKASEDSRPLGRLEFNGCPLRLNMIMTGDESYRILAVMADPFKPVGKDGQLNVYGSGKFMSVDMLVNTVEALCAKADSDCARVERDLAEWEKELVNTDAVVAGLQAVDVSVRQELEGKLKALEADMQANPFAGALPPPKGSSKCLMRFDAGAKAEAVSKAKESAHEEGAEMTVTAAALAGTAVGSSSDESSRKGVRRR